MVRRRKKSRQDVYRTNFDRLSSYPSYKEAVRAGREREPRGPKPGDTLRVRVTGVDDEGRPTGSYMGLTVVLTGGDFEPGELVEAVVEKVSGRIIYAAPLKGK